jgi:nicotinamide-nucleotide amidase
MTVEIINTGTELMLGRVLNTHQQWLCRRLSDRGYEVRRQTSIPDTGPAIQDAVRDALGRAALVITTGGLGPTSDDLTRELIAQMLGCPLEEDPAVLAHIRHYFTSRKRPMPPSTGVQALVPRGAVVLSNPNGTAPGLAIRVDSGALHPAPSPAWLIMLPGPPRELRPMFDNLVRPLLDQVLPPPDTFICRTLRTTGIGESVVEERLAKRLQPWVCKGLQVGYCARTGQVDVRLSARGPAAADLVETAEAIVRQNLAAYVYGENDDELEFLVIRVLTERGLTLALAESCTGGLLAHRLTNVPGASAVLAAGIVSYSNAAKQNFLGVPESDLRQHGAVSEAVARAMAEGARTQTHADLGLGITGIAGPAGGSADKPVGTVFIALAHRNGTRVVRQFNPYDRETFKNVTTQQALDLLRQEVGLPGQPEKIS